MFNPPLDRRISTKRRTSPVLQRGVLVIPISIEMDPYGFMAPFQRVTAFEKSPTEITEEVRGLISRHDSLAAVAKAGLVASQAELIQTFLSSSNFGDSTSLLRKIEALPEIPENLLKALAGGWQENDQISGCNGIPSRMSSLFRKHGFKEKKK